MLTRILLGMYLLFVALNVCIFGAQSTGWRSKPSKHPNVATAISTVLNALTAYALWLAIQ
jgi:hypothetical protein